jgi:hypothetical protein
MSRCSRKTVPTVRIGTSDIKPIQDKCAKRMYLYMAGLKNDAVIDEDGHHTSGFCFLLTGLC